MAHENYFELEAPTHFELGLQKGKLFGKSLRAALKDETRRRSWRRKVARAQPYLALAEECFPQLIEEFQGYAKGADVPFDDVWAWDLEDELNADAREKCTTFVTNDGFLIGHNEDWDEDSADDICVLRRTVGDHTAFELFYLHTLGGCAMSVNSHGVAQAVNSLVHTDHQVGIPKNVIARWLSDTAAPEQACSAVANMTRASGFHHLLVDATGRAWSFECTARQREFNKVNPPFVHSNHYVCERFRSLEGNDNRGGTFDRYNLAGSRVTPFMSIENSRELLGDSSLGRSKSLFNRRTIARMVLDIDHMTAHVWLAREREKGWVEYANLF
jgi:predicted choloylglycine hydrolase